MNTTLQLCLLLLSSYLLILVYLALFFALIWFRSRHCLINRLPDDALLLIFARLPLTDLLLLSGTCRRWQTLLPAATAARRALFLLDSSSSSLSRNLGYYYPSPIEDLASERILLCEQTYAHSLVKGCVPFILGVRLHPTKPNGRHSRSLYLPPLSPHLPRLFPNIRRLYISLQGPTTETLSLLLPLLSAWAPRLTTLHLSFTGVDQEGGSLSHESSHTLLIHLQVIINSMVRLKNLHFFITPPASLVTDGPIRLHLPIIAQLERFYLATQYFTDARDVDLALTQLAHAHPERPHLKEVGLLNWVTLEALQLMAPHLANAFVRLSLSGSIVEDTLATFTRLSTLWSSLRSLTFETDLPLSRLLPALRPLNRLVDLVLYANSRNNEHSEESTVHLPSVKRLRLYHCLTTHQSLMEGVQHLGRVFPGVQVVAVKSRSDHCEDCGYRHAPGHLGDGQRAIVPFDQSVAAGCDRQGVEYLREEAVFPNLRLIWQSNRQNWNEWGDDTFVYLPVYIV